MRTIIVEDFWGQGGFPFFVLCFGMRTYWNAAQFPENISCHSTLIFWHRRQEMLPNLSGVFQVQGFEIERSNAAHFLSKQKSIKSIVAFLLQTRTIAEEEFWGPDGFCSCSLFWYEDRLKCCPIFQAIFVVIRQDSFWDTRQKMLPHFEE